MDTKFKVKECVCVANLLNWKYFERCNMATSVMKITHSNITVRFSVCVTKSIEYKGMCCCVSFSDEPLCTWHIQDTVAYLHSSIYASINWFGDLTKLIDIVLNNVICLIKWLI